MKNKGMRTAQKFANYQYSHLDIRRIISNSIAVGDFFRSFLSKSEKALLFRQRTRVAPLSENSGHSYNSMSDDFEDQSSFVDALKDFQPNNDFKRKLVLGVLYRHGNIPHDISFDRAEGKDSVKIQEISEACT